MSNIKKIKYYFAIFRLYRKLGLHGYGYTTVFATSKKEAIQKIETKFGETIEVKKVDSPNYKVKFKAIKEGSKHD